MKNLLLNFIKTITIILISRASLFNLSVTPYLFSNITMLAVGIWVICDQNSVDAIFMVKIFYFEVISKLKYFY